jgi:hypothetical protein
MVQSAEKFNHPATARHYIDLYEKMLNRPLFNNLPEKEPSQNKAKVLHLR